MSENLRRLRKEAYITDKGRKWTLEEEAKRIARERKKEYAGLPRWHARYEELSGMSKIEELERKTEEANKEEQRVKEELKKTEEEYKKIIKEIISIIDARRGDEARDSSTYFNLAQKYKDIPTVSKIFLELSEAEDSHQKKLLLLGNALEREIGLYSEKYKAFR